jgi:hypothetical protein
MGCKTSEGTSSIFGDSHLRQGRFDEAVPAQKQPLSQNEKVFDLNLFVQQIVIPLQEEGRM